MNYQGPLQTGLFFKILWSIFFVVKLFFFFSSQIIKHAICGGLFENEYAQDLRTGNDWILKKTKFDIGLRTQAVVCFSSELSIWTSVLGAWWSVSILPLPYITQGHEIFGKENFNWFHLSLMKWEKGSYFMAESYMESTEVRCVKLKLVFMITSQVSNFEILDIWTSARHLSLLLNRIALHRSSVPTSSSLQG